MFFMDRLLNFLTFQAWKMNYLNSTTLITITTTCTNPVCMYVAGSISNNLTSYLYPDDTGSR